MSLAVSQEPSVSVIVTSSEQPELLVHSLCSAAAQTYPHREILVQDDATTDGVAKAAAECAAPISYQRQDRRGLALARNNAIRRSRGELIALLDAGDVWRPEKLATCVAYLQAHPEADLVYSPMAEIDAAGPADDCREGWVFAEIFEHCWIRDSTVVFHRRVWERIGGFDERWTTCVGHNFWLRAAVAHRFGVVREPLVTTHNSGEPPSAAVRLQELRERAEMLARYYEFQGGKERLDQPARTAIARACCDAAVLALRQGDAALAEFGFRVATAYQPTWLHRGGWMWAAVQRRFRGLPACDLAAMS